MSILLCDTIDDAIIAYVVKKWDQLDASNRTPLGRIMIQKIIYFLKAKGIPVEFDFDLYHYGPYSQELYFRMDDHLADEIVMDVATHPNKSEYKPGNNVDEIINSFTGELKTLTQDIDDIIDLFNQFPSSSMELLATIHYLQTTSTKYYGSPPSKDHVVKEVLRIKGTKFSDDLVGRVYDALEETGLFQWNNN